MLWTMMGIMKFCATGPRSGRGAVEFRWSFKGWKVVCFFIDGETKGRRLKPMGNLGDSMGKTK